MEIKKQYIQEYLHAIAIRQIAEEYVQKGYQVGTNETLGNYEADLIARRGEETIVVEVKTGRMTPERKHAIAQLGNYVRKQRNYKFLVAIATPPKEKKLEIAEIEGLLTEYLSNHFPSELDELSTHTQLEEVTDIDIDEISIDRNLIFVKGDGVINVKLQFGSGGDQDSDNGFMDYESFSFDFKITLAYDREEKLQIAKVEKLEIDTSSYHDAE